MKYFKIFNIWSNYLLLNIVGFVFLFLASYTLLYNPVMAFILFLVPYILFLRAIFLQFFRKD